MIGRIIRWLTGPLGAVLAGMLALAGAWAAGRQSARQEAGNEALRGYQETRRRLDDAARDLPDDDGVLRDWLLGRGRKS